MVSNDDGMEPLVPPEKRVVRRATREDIDRYFGERKIPYTLTAWAGLLDDEPVAIVGLAHIGGRVMAFFDAKDEARPYKKEIWGGLKRGVDEIKASGRYRYIFAACDPNEPAAPRMLSYFGFEPTEEAETTNLWRLDLRGNR